MYQITLNPPSTLKNNGWDYPEGYFPRKTYYKRDAKAIAARATFLGATNVKIENLKKVKEPDFTAIDAANKQAEDEKTRIEEQPDFTAIDAAFSE